MHAHSIEHLDPWLKKKKNLIIRNIFWMLLNFAENNGKRYCILIITGEELSCSLELFHVQGVGAESGGLQPLL